MELALCYTCFMAKWRIHSKFLSDIPPEAQGELCAQCRSAVAIIRVEAAILALPKPTVQKKLDEIATAAFEANRQVIREFGLNAKNISDPVGLIVPMIADAVVHEWLHHEAGLEERSARFGTEHVLKALSHPGWPRTATSLANMVWVLSRGQDAPHIEPPEETAN